MIKTFRYEWFGLSENDVLWSSGISVQIVAVHNPPSVDMDVEESNLSVFDEVMRDAWKLKRIGEVVDGVLVPNP